jgi:hypothetical protein
MLRKLLGLGLGLGWRNGWAGIRIMSIDLRDTYS